jgi:hypothetical protein
MPPQIPPASASRLPRLYPRAAIGSRMVRTTAATQTRALQTSGVPAGAGSWGGLPLSSAFSSLPILK